MLKPGIGFTLNKYNSLEVVTFLMDLWLKTVISFEISNIRNNKGHNYYRKSAKRVLMKKSGD